MAFLSNSQGGRRSNSHRRKPLGSRLSAPERLEDRRLLAGDVSPFDNVGDITFSGGGANVLLHYEATSIAGGLTRYDVYVDDPTNALRSYFLDAVSFTGLIQQDAAGPSNTIRVNDDASAAIHDGNNYDPAVDSYFFQPFTQNTITPAITDTGGAEGLAQRTFGITAGSGPDSTLDLVQIAQIVASGDVTVAGVLSRNGVNLFIPDGGNRVMRAEADDSPTETIGSAVVALGVQRLLGHGLSAPEVATFDALIEGGATRAQLAHELWVLPENLANRVNALYQSILHRAPTQPERDAQVAVLTGGGTEKQIAKTLLTSAEYNQSHMSNAQFVDGLYADLLGRAADPAGRAAWLTALSTTSTRSQVIDAFLASAEYNLRVTNQLSLQILQRAGGGTPGAGDARAIGEAMLASDEFARQALNAGLTSANRALTEALAQRLSGRAATLDELARSVLAQQTASPRPAIVDTAWHSNSHLVRQVDSIFRTILHRPADPVGSAHYVQTLAAGSGIDSVMMSLINSAEYQNAHASNGAFVDGLYRDILGRAADAAGRNAWLAALGAGTTRSAAAQAFLNSTERRLRVIDSIYLNVLGRPADPGGRQAYLLAWQQGSTPDALARSLLASDEFFNRFAV